MKRSYLQIFGTLLFTACAAGGVLEGVTADGLSLAERIIWPTGVAGFAVALISVVWWDKWHK